MRRAISILIMLILVVPLAHFVASDLDHQLELNPTVVLKGDSVLGENVIASFEGDSVLGENVIASFEGDSVLGKNVIASFEGDSVLRKNAALSQILVQLRYV